MSNLCGSSSTVPPRIPVWLQRYCRLIVGEAPEGMISTDRSRPGMMFGRRRGFAPIILICLSLAWPVALTQEIDEGEFSRSTLGYKLQLLKSQFEQTEMGLLTQGAAASNAEKLERIYSEIKRLELEFWGARYYPDLLDEQMVVIGEELRLILVDPAATRSMSEPAFL